MFLIMNKLFIAPDGDYDMDAAVTIKLYSYRELTRDESHGEIRLIISSVTKYQPYQ